MVRGPVDLNCGHKGKWKRNCELLLEEPADILLVWTHSLPSALFFSFYNTRFSFYSESKVPTNVLAKTTCMPQIAVPWSEACDCLVSKQARECSIEHLDPVSLLMHLGLRQEAGPLCEIYFGAGTISLGKHCLPVAPLVWLCLLRNSILEIPS